MTAPDESSSRSLQRRQEISNLRQLLERIEKLADQKDEITLGLIVEAVGSRSFGPLLLLAGVIMTSPISGVPGVPTSMAIVILLIAGQLLFRRGQFWLPDWILRRSVSSVRTYRILRFLRPLAGFVDRFLRPRLLALTEGVSIYVIAVACAVIAFAMPVMELVPFSVHAAGIAVMAFGLSLIARDGLLALVAFVVTACTCGLVVYNMLE